MSTWDPFRNLIVPLDLFLNLYKTNLTLVRRLDEQLQPFHLTLGRLCLLVALRRTDRAMLPSELGGDLDVTRANVSGLLNALEKHGYIRREFDPSDRRRILVTLTESGASVLDLAWPIYEESVSVGFGKLSDEEMQTFLQLLRKMNE